MAADVDKVIAEVQSLSPEDQVRLREVLIRELNGATSAPCEPNRLTDLDYQRLLMRAGLLRSVKKRSRDQEAFARFSPVRVSGKPLSETIVEERR